jgi:GntR family transcriptional repressor for pyruvate dehydrogenase complex
VESRQKVGAVITDRRNAAMMDAFSFAIEISAETFQDIQGFRRLIEVNLADALVSNIDEPTIADLETINAAMQASTNPGEASNLDFRFHRLLVAVAGNRTLREMYDMLEPIIRNLMENGKSIPRRLEGAYREHQELVAALRARDRIAFAYHMNRHLDDGLHVVASPIASGDDRQG